MKRFLSLFLTMLAALPALAFTTTSASNASQNNGTVRAVMEPVISVVQINGVTHGAAAYVNFPDAVNNPLNAQIQVVHTTDFVNWSAPVNLPLNATNGITYQRSADPVFIEGNGWPYIGWIFCFGTMWTNINNRGRSTIGAWYSTDGGVTWSAPEALDAPPYDPSCEQYGTCIFDDKPAAAIAPAPNISGQIYVAWTRTTPYTTSVYMSMLIPTRGWAFIGRVGEEFMPPLPGPTPVVDQSTGKPFLFLMDRTPGNNRIRVFYSADAGWTWNDTGNPIAAPGIDVQGVQVGSANVRAIPFLSVKYDAQYGHMLLLYHRGVSGGGVEVVYHRFSPYTWVATAPGQLNPNGHRQWNPTVVQMPGSNDFVFTYYDYNPGDPGYTLYASRMNLYGLVPETTKVYGPEFSDPTNYNLDGFGFSRIGEYQGLAVFNNTLYAATIYIPQSTPRVGNAYVVRFTTP